MKIKEIVGMVDHTILKQQSTWEQVRETLDDAVKYGAASACLPPAYVKQAKEYVGPDFKICTVIGFPNGSNTTAVKCFETEDAIKNGAEEIDMVININWVKDKRYDDVLNEIKAIKKACNGMVLKVIVETCLLTEEEKIKMCQIVSESGAEYIKTSTGFSTGGATKEDIALFAAHVRPGVGIKAAGGMDNYHDAKAFIELGATRLGSSRVIKSIKKENLDMESEC